MQLRLLEFDGIDEKVRIMIPLNSEEKKSELRAVNLLDKNPQLPFEFFIQ